MALEVFSLIFQYLASVIIIYYILFLYEKRKFLKFAWNNKAFFIPVLPVVGNSYAFLIISLLNGFRVNAIALSQKGKKHIGYPFNLWVGSCYHYCTINPEELKIIFNDPMCNSKGVIYEPLSFIFKNSILTVSHKEWRLKRRYFQNGFKPSVLKKFIPTFYKESCKLLKDIQMLNGNDIFKLFCKHSFTNFFLTSSGLKHDSSYLDLNEVGLLTFRMQEQFKTKLLFPYIPEKLWLRLFPSYKELFDCCLSFKTIVVKIIEQKRIQNNGTQEEISTDKTLPLLDLIVRDSKGLIDNIYEELAFFSAAATETTGTALSFCFTLLGMHPTIQETLYNEVVDKIGFNDILSDDLPTLKYTEAVILETMRVFAPIPFLTRCAEADVDLGTKTIPKGSNIIIDIFHIQRDEKYWPNPLKFDPTRFLFENIEAHKPYTYFPFSAGPRDCLGKAQAMAMMKTTIATIIRKYRVTSKYKNVDDIVLTSTLTLQSEEPLDCQFTLRRDD